MELDDPLRQSEAGRRVLLVSTDPAHSTADVLGAELGPDERRLTENLWAVEIDPDYPDVIYVGTGEGYFREIVRGTWLPLRGAGIFVTTDGGSSWERLPSTTTEDFHWVNDLVTSPRHPERLYAATRTGVWLSENRGESWSRLLEATEYGGCLDLALRTGSVLATRDAELQRAAPQAGVTLFAG